MGAFLEFEYSIPNFIQFGSSLEYYDKNLDINDIGYLIRNDLFKINNRLVYHNDKILLDLWIKDFSIGVNHVFAKNNDNYLNEIRSIDGIGNSQTDSLKKFLSNGKNLKNILKLINILDIENYKFLNKKTSISGKLIMFTGGFVNKSRSELKSLAENMGAKIVSNISKKTDYLVVGSQKPTIRKILADFYRSNRYFKLAAKQYSELIKNKEKNLWNFLYLRLNPKN